MLAGLQLDCSNLELLWPSTGECTTQVLCSGNRLGGLGVAFRSGKPASEEARDTLFQHDNFVFHASFQGFALQQLEGFFYGLMRQAKCSVMHGDHPAGLEIEKGASGVGGTGVDIAKLGWIVGADGSSASSGDRRRPISRKPAK